MNYMDPTLEWDLASPSMPWALTPLITTMPYLEHTRLEGTVQAPPFPPQTPVGNKTPELRFANDDRAGEAARSSARRQSFFRDGVRRKAVVFGPAGLVTADFCYNYLRFSPQGVDLRLQAVDRHDEVLRWPARALCVLRACAGEAGAARGQSHGGRVF
ncbi:hypothetical protein AcV5_001400 [Taiwanofungus camphoratus]|nr:hypothetical protein AcV5_001400 [Antrodia cinnamomea]